MDTVAYSPESPEGELALCLSVVVESSIVLVRPFVVLFAFGSHTEQERPATTLQR